MLGLPLNPINKCREHFSNTIYDWSENEGCSYKVGKINVNYILFSEYKKYNCFLRSN